MLLWLVYGIRVHAVAVIWANALAAVMVLISIILKANPPAKKLDLQSRDFGQSGFASPLTWMKSSPTAFGKQLHIYNQRTGANLTPEMVASKGLGAADSARSLGRVSGIPHEDGFFADLELIEGSREALLELSRQP